MTLTLDRIKSKNWPFDTCWINGCAYSFVTKSELLYRLESMIITNMTQNKGLTETRESLNPQ